MRTSRNNAPDQESLSTDAHATSLGYRVIQLAHSHGAFATSSSGLRTWAENPDLLTNPLSNFCSFAERYTTNPGRPQFAGSSSILYLSPSNLSPSHLM